MTEEKNKSEFLDIDFIKNNYIDSWKKWNVIEGKASRKEFWYFFLTSLLVGCIASIFPVLGLIYAIAVFAPMGTITIRRLHDMNKSMFWFLPVVVFFGLFVLTKFGILLGVSIIAVFFGSLLLWMLLPAIIFAVLVLYWCALQPNTKAEN